MKKLDIKSEPIKAEGYLLPWNPSEEQPCFIQIENTIFIPLFSDEEKLQMHLEFVDYQHETSVKIITDTDDFLDSVKPYRVALNPRITIKGTTRFTEILQQPKV